MSVQAITRRYAQALADVATERNQIEQIGLDLEAFVRIMESSAELRSLFASPIISQGDKASVLNALIERVKPGQLTANLLRAMLGNGRLHHLPEVYEQFRREINDRKGLIVAEVTSATRMDESEQQKLAGTLSRLTGKQIQFKLNVDPSLIGGAVTRIGSIVYDGSVRTQLREIKQRLKAAEAEEK